VRDEIEREREIDDGIDDDDDDAGAMRRCSFFRR